MVRAVPRVARAGVGRGSNRGSSRDVVRPRLVLAGVARRRRGRGRMEARYGSLRGPTLVAPPVGAEYNSARYVRAAAALTVRPNPSSYGMAMAYLRDFEKRPGSSEAPRDVQTFLDANTDAMR